MAAFEVKGMWKASNDESALQLSCMYGHPKFKGALNGLCMARTEAMGSEWKARGTCPCLAALPEALGP